MTLLPLVSGGIKAKLIPIEIRQVEGWSSSWEVALKASFCLDSLEGLPSQNPFPEHNVISAREIGDGLRGYSSILFPRPT